MPGASDDQGSRGNLERPPSTACLEPLEDLPNDSPYLPHASDGKMCELDGVHEVKLAGTEVAIHDGEPRGVGAAVIFRGWAFPTCNASPVELSPFARRRGGFRVTATSSQAGTMAPKRVEKELQRAKAMQVADVLGKELVVINTGHVHVP